jgi:hypothetical protein
MVIKIMMKKILSLLFCTLLIVNVLPVVGFSIQIFDINNIQSDKQAPLPGEAPIPPLNTMIDTSIANEHIEITSATLDDIVVSMIEQVDESIYMSYLENITGFGPRRTGTSACVAAAEYIFNQFESMGLAVRYHHWTNAGYTSDNVEATLNGTNETSDDIYIVCAHYDTVTSSPGADDDGSGTVAVLTAAYIMSQYQFNHTIKFVTFSGEEQGLLGSEVYAQEAKAQGWDIKGVLNADMISYAITTTDGSNLIVYENTASEWLYTYTLNINTEYNDYIHLTLHHGGSTWGSDHNSFWDQGYNALFYFEYTETPYYHSSGDTIDHINATYAVKNVRLILATLAELTEPGFPSNPPDVPEITGPTMVTVNEISTYNIVTTDPDGDDVYYFVDWGDGNNSGWIGPYNSGIPTQTSHIWTGLGSFMVKVRAKDVYGVRSDWSDTLIVIVSDNRPPNVPTINGPNHVKVGVTQDYEISSIEPDGQVVYFFIYWGDGGYTGWIGPYNSSEVVIISHKWDKKGSFTINARAKDVVGYESNWTQLKITVPRNTNTVNTLLYHFLQQLQLLKDKIIDFFFY